jgi:hypothetical protein
MLPSSWKELHDSLEVIGQSGRSFYSSSMPAMGERSFTSRMFRGTARTSMTGDDTPSATSSGLRSPMSDDDTTATTTTTTATDAGVRRRAANEAALSLSLNATIFSFMSGGSFEPKFDEVSFFGRRGPTPPIISLLSPSVPTHGPGSRINGFHSFSEESAEVADDGSSSEHPKHRSSSFLSDDLQFGIDYD